MGSFQPPFSESVFHVALIGSVDRPEFADAVASVRSVGRAWECSTLEELEIQINREQSRPVFDCIVILNTMAGEHALRTLDHVRNKYPLTPIVSVGGSWCQGETRSGIPLPGTHRIAWYDWKFVGEKELTALKNRGYSSWGLPSSYAEDEILLESERRRINRFEISSNPKIGCVFSDSTVCRRDFEMNRLLTDILVRAGFQTRPFEWDGVSPPNSNQEPKLLTESNFLSEIPDVILWDIGKMDFQDMIANVKKIKATAPHTHLALFIQGPQIAENQLLYGAGVDFIFPKPFILTALWDYLDTVKV